MVSEISGSIIGYSGAVLLPSSPNPDLAPLSEAEREKLAAERAVWRGEKDLQEFGTRFGEATEVSIRDIRTDSPGKGDGVAGLGLEERRKVRDGYEEFGVLGEILNKVINGEIKLEPGETIQDLIKKLNGLGEITDISIANNGNAIVTDSNGKTVTLTPEQLEELAQLTGTPLQTQGEFSDILENSGYNQLHGQYFLEAVKDLGSLFKESDSFSDNTLLNAIADAYSNNTEKSLIDFKV